MQPNDEVLDLFAGLGNIAEAVVSRVSALVDDERYRNNNNPTMTNIELDPNGAAYLEKAGHQVHQADAFIVEGEVDVIIMHPPADRDLDALSLGWGLLKPGGRMVALVREDIQTRADASEFRDWLDKSTECVVDHIEAVGDHPVLPDNMLVLALRKANRD